MPTPTNTDTGDAQTVASPAQPGKLRAALNAAVNWPGSQLERSSRSRPTRISLILICALIFASAVGVRLLHWQDSHVNILSGNTALSGVFSRYDKDARQMLDEGRILYPRELPPDGDARMLTHPPGYPIILAAIYQMAIDPPFPALWLLQIVCDGLASLLVFLIAMKLLNWFVATIAGMLVATSPHLAHYSLLPLPDSLVALPILIAVYLITIAQKRPHLWLIIAAGACVGLTCWLRANALLLAPFLGVAVFLVFERRKRLIYAGALVATTIVVISPITVRNMIVFRRFIPLSIQAGLNLVEGIGDFDRDGKLGMPRSDREARFKDAEWHGRPDYAATLWKPDGIARDRARFDRGISVIRSNPAWFAGVILRRAAFMLSYNESRARPRPFGTAGIPPVFARAGYGHHIETTGLDQSTVLVLNGAIIPEALAVNSEREPARSISPADLSANGTIISPQASFSLQDDSRMFKLNGDNSPYGDQFESEIISVKEHTDYVMVLPVKMERGDMALKVASADRRIGLNVAGLASALKEDEPSLSKDAAVDPAAEQQMTVIQMPFASGDRTDVRLVLSNNSETQGPPALQIGAAELFEIGPTPYAWTHYPRLLVRSIQRNFTTARIRTLIALGIILFVIARRGRALVLLLSVPLYYLLIQSPLHTEYRYILVIHYFLFVVAATAVYFAGAAFFQTASRVYDMLPVRVRRRQA